MCGRPAAKADPNETRVFETMLQRSIGELVSATTRIFAPCTTDDVVHAPILNQLLAMIMTTEVHLCTMLAQQRVKLLKQRGSDPMAAPRIDWMVAKNDFPISTGPPQLRRKPRYLLSISIPSQNSISHVGTSSPNSGVDEKRVHDHVVVFEALFVPEVRHSPPTPSVRTMPRKVSLSPCICAPIVIASDEKPRPVQSLMSQVNVPPPIHDILRVFCPVLVNIVSDGRDGCWLSC